jgi:hypothetical protein
MTKFYTDFMLDLETLGRGPNAAILSIGAVAFDLQTMSENTFEQRIDLASAMRGGKVDASTVRWWMQQDHDAREALFDQAGTVSLSTALADFGAWIGQFCPKPDRRVWGNGASFDNVILRSAYEFHNHDAPWGYWGDRCFRTLRNLHPGFDLPFEGVRHSALADARHQVRMIHAFAEFSEGRLVLDWGN